MGPQLKTENSNLSIQRLLWFTLVELIVVITILAILSTIGFISFLWFASSARDSKRIWDMNTIHRWLLFMIESWQLLPVPNTNATEIYSSWALVATQWDFDELIWWQARVFWDLRDPQDEQFYSYVVSQDRRKFAVGWLTESLVGYSPNNPSLLHNQAHADLRQVYIRWDRVGMYFDIDNTPIQRTWVTDLDLFTVSDVYKVHFSTRDKLEWDNQVLMMASPTASCRRIFDTVSHYAWNSVYTINPRWEEFQVFCHTSFPDMNFYDFIEDGDFEDMYSNNWDNNRKSPAAARTGEYGLRYDTHRTVVSNNFTYVDATKNYRISGYFRSVWEQQSRLYYWFAEYDENFQLIVNRFVNVVQDTETVLTEPVQHWDTSITFENIDWTMCDFWESRSTFYTHAVVAFDIDDSWMYRDLPNRNVNPNNWTYINPPQNTQWRSMRSMVNNWSTCTVHFWGHMVHNYPAGTKIRMHQSWWTYNYRAASGVVVPNEWTYYSGEVQWMQLFGANNSQFRPGTKFIKPLILVNHRYRSNHPNHWMNEFMILDIDDIVLEPF